jgi:hypothetical protein
MLIREHRSTRMATKAGDGYPALASIHDKDEVSFDSD